MFRSHWFIGGWLSLAMVLFFSSASLFAQWSPSSKRPPLHYGYNPGYYAGSNLYIPPAAKGYQVTKMIEQHYTVTERTTSAPPVPRSVPAEPAPSSLAVGINPPPAEPKMVAIRGPDGQVRHFPLASPEAIQPRTIIVHPGEKLSITINGPVSVQIQRK